MRGVTNTIVDRIIDRMKVTAIIPDALVSEVQRLAGRKNLTESIIAALTEWAALQKIRELNRRVEKQPLRFQPGFTAAGVRELNRRAP
jgi:hypothetical protein